MTASGAAPIGFTLRVPPRWYEFDVWRATRSRELARLVDARIAEQPALAARRAGVLRFLRDVAGDAERHGAVYCAAMAEPVQGGGHLLASCTVLQTPGPADRAERTVESIAAGITAVAGSPESSAWRGVQLLSLAAGPAVRVREVATVDTGGAVPQCVAMHTLLPHPDGGGVVDVVLASPQVHLAEAMLDVFDAISGTFAWLPPDAEEGRR
jgi:hypothetical protein